MKILSIQETKEGWEAIAEFHEKKAEGKKLINIVESVFYPRQTLTPTDFTPGVVKSIGNFCVKGFVRFMPKTIPRFEEHSQAFAYGSRLGTSKITRDWVDGKGDEIALNEDGDEKFYKITGQYEHKKDPNLVRRIQWFERQILDEEQKVALKELKEEMQAKRGAKLPLEAFYPLEYILTFNEAGEKEWMAKPWFDKLQEDKKGVKQSISNGLKMALSWALGEAKGQEEIAEIFNFFSIPIKENKENRNFNKAKIVELEIGPCKTASWSERTYTPKHYQTRRLDDSKKSSWAERVQKMFKAGQLDEFQASYARKLGFI